MPSQDLSVITNEKRKATAPARQEASSTSKKKKTDEPLPIVNSLSGLEPDTARADHLIDEPTFDSIFKTLQTPEVTVLDPIESSLSTVQPVSRFVVALIGHETSDIAVFDRSGRTITAVSPQPGSIDIEIENLLFKRAELFGPTSGPWRLLERPSIPGSTTATIVRVIDTLHDDKHGLSQHLSPLVLHVHQAYLQRLIALGKRHSMTPDLDPWVEMEQEPDLLSEPEQLDLDRVRDAWDDLLRDTLRQVRSAQDMMGRLDQLQALHGDGYLPPTASTDLFHRTREHLETVQRNSKDVSSMLNAVVKAAGVSRQAVNDDSAEDDDLSFEDMEREHVY